MLLCRSAILLAVFLVASTTFAQGFDVSVSPSLLLGQLPATDDIVVTPAGEIIVSQPTNQQLVKLNPGGVPLSVPLPTAPVSVLAMTIGPDGALYYGDSLAGTVIRHELATGAETTLMSGLNIPIDIVFESPTRLYVCDQTNNDFFNGPCDVHQVDLVAGVVASDTIVVPGVPGAADVVVLGPQRIAVSSLGAIVVVELDLVSGAFTAHGNNIFLPSDMEVTPGGRILISTLFEARVWELDPVTSAQVDLTSFLGPGSGAEDMAFTAAGDLLVVINSGEIWEIDLTSTLRQVGDARLGASFGLRLDDPTSANWTYALAASQTLTQGIVIPGTSLVIPLDADIAFNLSTASPRPSILANFDGFLDTGGQAEAGVQVLASPAFLGMTFHFAGIMYSSPLDPLSSWKVTNAVQVTIVP